MAARSAFAKVERDRDRHIPEKTSLEPRVKVASISTFQTRRCTAACRQQSVQFEAAYWDHGLEEMVVRVSSPAGQGYKIDARHIDIDGLRHRKGMRSGSSCCRTLSVQGWSAEKSGIDGRKL